MCVIVYLYVCVCVCVCVCACGVCVTICLCLCVCVYVNVRMRVWISSLINHHHTAWCHMELRSYLWMSADTGRALVTATGHQPVRSIISLGCSGIWASSGLDGP
ncbi:hypothetical protein NL108_006269 [Boleophthalmus pectinirostris]|nr:hypothetical protein NL108_006269 [Boleophthalmus pectinirostris]